MFSFGGMNFSSRQEAQDWCDKRLDYAKNDPSVLKASDYVGPRSKSPPFGNMSVGDKLVFDIPIPYIQSRAHAYGQYHKKKFKTWQDWPCLVIERIS